MTQWISVDERLPEKNTAVLIWCTENPEIVVALWSDFPGDYMIHGVTHWMPLPEAPK